MDFMYHRAMQNSHTNISPGIGHVISAMEFATRLISHDHLLSITLLDMRAPFNPFLNFYVRSLLDSFPRITFVDLPDTQPPLTWPIYVEQQLIAFRLVKELGLAVELRLGYRKDCGEVVMADEIERGVRLLMEGNGGEIRRKVKEMREAARKSPCPGGSSYDSIQ